MIFGNIKCASSRKAREDLIQKNKLGREMKKKNYVYTKMGLLFLFITF